MKCVRPLVSVSLPGRPPLNSPQRRGEINKKMSPGEVRGGHGLAQRGRAAGLKSPVLPPYFCRPCFGNIQSRRSQMGGVRMRAFYAGSHGAQAAAGAASAGRRGVPAGAPRRPDRRGADQLARRGAADAARLRRRRRRADAAAGDPPQNPAAKPMDPSLDLGDLGKLAARDADLRRRQARGGAGFPGRPAGAAAGGAVSGGAAPRLPRAGGGGAVPARPYRRAGPAAARPQPQGPAARLARRLHGRRALQPGAQGDGRTPAGVGAAGAARRARTLALAYAASRMWRAYPPDAGPVSRRPRRIEWRSGYGPLLDLCRLLADALGPTDAAGTTACPAFLLDMERVFEQPRHTRRHGGNDRR